MVLDWISEKNYESQLYRWGDLQQELLRGLRLDSAGYGEEDVQSALGRM
jgi:hypothetical protein